MNPNQITLRGLLVWFICALFFMYEFLLRTVLGTFQFPIMEELQLSPVKFAILSSTAYQLIYGIMQLPVGIILDKFGLKKTIFGAVVICGLANIGFSLTHEFTFAILFRVMMGFGSAFGFVCLLVAVYDWMPRKNVGLFIGLSQFIGTMGPMLAAGPLNYLTETNMVGWRGFFISLAITASVLAILVLGFVDNKRETSGKFLILNRPSSMWDNLKKLFHQPQIWFIAFFSASIYFSIEYLSENEGVSFLIEKGFSSTFSAYMITVAWLGYAISCPFLGFFSDWLQMRKPVMIFAALAMILGLFGIVYLPLGATGTMACFFLLGFGAGGQSIGFAIIAEQCKEQYLAVGLAFNNGMIMLMAALNSPFIGYVLSKVSGSDTGHTLANYREAFMILVILAGLSFLLSTFFIKETFGKSMKETTRLNP